MASCRFFMIASCDDDGGVSGLDRRWTGLDPQRHDATSTVPRLGRSPPHRGGERFPRLRGAASWGRARKVSRTIWDVMAADAHEQSPDVSRYG